MQNEKARKLRGEKYFREFVKMVKSAAGDAFVVDYAMTGESGKKNKIDSYIKEIGECMHDVQMLTTEKENAPVISAGRIEKTINRAVFDLVNIRYRLYKELEARQGREFLEGLEGE